MPEAIPYGYDVATDTVRVSRHDLARLLLQFREELEKRGDRAWLHMVDYDKSFERLADAVDYGRAPFAALNQMTYEGPDYRMRCKRSPVYGWHEHYAPDASQPVEAVRLRAARYGSHYAYRENRGGEYSSGIALCGFSFAWKEDGAKLIEGEPSCRECVREKALAAALGAESP
jgi:hypothetical protein